MADGTQREFNIPRHLPATRLRAGEIVVDANLEPVAEPLRMAA